jgi:negative regulator of flagellin synthesis FlgM
MKVSDTGNPAGEVIQQYKINSKTNVDSNKQSNVSAVPEEKVSLSSRARDVQQIKKAVDELPDVRQERVEALKKQIEQGNYKVDGEKVAQKMVGESLLDILA